MKHEVLELFTYIEPDISNFSAYSIKILSLLTQTCIAIESLFKSILKVNNFKPLEREMNIKIYSKLDTTHRLSEFSVEILSIQTHIFTPFASFLDNNAKARSPSWYSAYNSSKHNSFSNFKDANFKNLLSALAGLFILYVSVSGEGFDAGPTHMVLKEREIDVDGIKVKGNVFELKIHSFFNLTSVPNWPEDQKYNIDWKSITDQDSYQKLDI